MLETIQVALIHVSPPTTLLGSRSGGVLSHQLAVGAGFQIFNLEIVLDAVQETLIKQRLGLVIKIGPAERSQDLLQVMEVHIENSHSQESILGYRCKILEETNNDLPRSGMGRTNNRPFSFPAPQVELTLGHYQRLNAVIAAGQPAGGVRLNVTPVAELGRDQHAPNCDLITKRLALQGNVHDKAPQLGEPEDVDLAHDAQGSKNGSILLHLAQVQVFVVCLHRLKVEELAGGFDSSPQGTVEGFEEFMHIVHENFLRPRREHGQELPIREACTAMVHDAAHGQQADRR